MKKKSIVLIAVLATVITISGCGSPAGKTLENKTEAEGAGSPVIQNDGVETTESMQTSEEETDSISEYFTNEQLEHIRQALGILDDLPVEIEIGDPYYWEGGDMDLIQIDFYHEGDYVAGAAFKPYTEEMARNIYQYSE